LGCGTGSFKSVFEASNFTYFGVDIDNNDELNNIQKCDITSQSLPFEDNSYDLIFFKMVIEHLTIEEISNCL
jgi:predicted SAM-dependent methyltransferase